MHASIQSNLLFHQARAVPEYSEGFSGSSHPVSEEGRIVAIENMLDIRTERLIKYLPILCSLAKHPMKRELPPFRIKVPILLVLQEQCAFIKSHNLFSSFALFLEFQEMRLHRTLELELIERRVDSRGKFIALERADADVDLKIEVGLLFLHTSVHH